MAMTDDEAMQQLHALMTQAIAARDSRVVSSKTPDAGVEPMVLTIKSGTDIEGQEPLVLKLNPHTNGSSLNGEVVGAD